MNLSPAQKSVHVQAISCQFLHGEGELKFENAFVYVHLYKWMQLLQNTKAKLNICHIICESLRNRRQETVRQSNITVL